MIRNIILHSILQYNKIFCYIVEQINAYHFFDTNTYISDNDYKYYNIWNSKKIIFLIKDRHILN